jgi:hypothetical protein
MIHWVLLDKKSLEPVPERYGNTNHSINITGTFRRYSISFIAFPVSLYSAGTLGKLADLLCVV